LPDAYKLYKHAKSCYYAILSFFLNKYLSRSRVNRKGHIKILFAIHTTLGKCDQVKTGQPKMSGKIKTLQWAECAN
jgi:hypothetical protein